jgi:hypothetical protein
MGCLEGSGVPIIYIGRMVLKVKAGIESLRAMLPAQILYWGF